jgi:hypothetical protein
MVKQVDNSSNLRPFIPHGTYATLCLKLYTLYFNCGVMLIENLEKIVSEYNKTFFFNNFKFRCITFASDFDWILRA